MNKIILIGFFLLMILLAIGELTALIWFVNAEHIPVFEMTMGGRAMYLCGILFLSVINVAIVHGLELDR